MLVDLSQPYRDGMFSQRLFPPVRVQRCIRIEERGLNVTELTSMYIALENPLRTVSKNSPSMGFSAGADDAKIKMEPVNLTHRRTKRWSWLRSPR